MKQLLILSMSLSLFACVEVNIDDLNTFVVETKSKVYPINDEVPSLKKIDALVFTQEKGRSPFSKPKAEVVAQKKNLPKSCPQPNFERKKQALEMYSLENIQMRGTLSINDELWALLRVSSGEVHKVRPGYYLGLHYGKILKITKNQIDLLELASDSNGCWQERITKITLLSE